MKTTESVFDALLCFLKSLAKQKDFVFRQKRNDGAHPLVYPFSLPPPNQMPADGFPYIVLFFSSENQELSQNPAIATVSFVIILGVFNPSMDISEGASEVFTGIEKIELALKKTGYMAGIADLVSIKKEIPREQPLPYFEGTITVIYNFYKPEFLPEP